MKRKIRFNYFTLLTGIMFLIPACTDSFLDIKVQGGVTTKTDPKLAEK